MVDRHYIYIYIYIYIVYIHPKISLIYKFVTFFFFIRSIETFINNLKTSYIMGKSLLKETRILLNPSDKITNTQSVFS